MISLTEPDHTKVKHLFAFIILVGFRASIFLIGTELELLETKKFLKYGLPFEF